MIETYTACLEDTGPSTGESIGDAPRNRTEPSGFAIRFTQPAPRVIHGPGHFVLWPEQKAFFGTLSAQATRSLHQDLSPERAARIELA